MDKCNAERCNIVININDIELDCVACYEYTPPVIGKLSGPAHACYEHQVAEIELLSLYYNGIDFGVLLAVTDILDDITEQIFEIKEDRS